jgi:prepilin-type N-terminal cleavage/methylation domain-containing protein
MSQNRANMRKFSCMQMNRYLMQVLSQSSTRQTGLTLLECLVAIAVIAASISVITPAVVLAVATRVQNQRADQAFQLAQAEVDRIKLIVERGGSYTLNIPTAPANISTAAQFPAGVNAPEILNATTFSTTYNAARPVDVNDDGVDDFGVQIFRTVGSTVGTRPVAFDLGVRVYRADVIDNKPATALTTTQAALTFTSGEGQSGSRPLAVIYTNIVKSDADRSLCDYNTYLNSTGGRTDSSPSQC